MASELSFLSAPHDTIPLAIHDWSPDPGETFRGSVILVHGLGEHAGRHAETARWLARRGWRVAAPDLRGHGRSGGARGAIPSLHSLLDDLAAVMDRQEHSMTAETGPPVLLGHSLGGALTARFVAEGITPVRGLILSSPALELGRPPWIRALTRLLARGAPSLPLPNGLAVAKISRDLEVVRAYRADPLVHRWITPLLAEFLFQCGERVNDLASQWRTPTLLLWAGADGLVDPRGSRRFALGVPASIMTAREYPQLYHEILNEPERDEVLSALETWLAKLAR